MTLSTATFIFFGVMGGLILLYGVNNWTVIRIVECIACVVFPAGCLAFCALTAFACFTGARHAGPIVLPLEAHPARSGLEATAVGLAIAAVTVLETVLSVRYRRRQHGYARPGGA